MSIQDLLVEQGVLNDAIYQLRNQIIKAEIDEANAEYILWTETDFKKLNLTNKEMRTSYIKNKMSQHIAKINSLKNDLKMTQNELSLNKTKIKIILEMGIDLNDSES